MQPLSLPGAEGGQRGGRGKSCAEGAEGGDLTPPYETLMEEKREDPIRKENVRFSSCGRGGKKGKLRADAEVGEANEMPNASP